MLVVCLECEGELEVSFANIINDDLALEESIICSACNKLLSRVYNSKR